MSPMRRARWTVGRVPGQASFALESGRQGPHKRGPRGLPTQAALERAQCPKEAVDEVYMGAVLQVSEVH